MPVVCMENLGIHKKKASEYNPLLKEALKPFFEWFVSRLVELFYFVYVLLSCL